MSALRSLALCASLLISRAAQAGELQVLSVEPAPQSGALATTDVTVHFDCPIATASVTPASFRVFGRGTGTAAGAFSFSNGNKDVTFNPAADFAAGELVNVNLSHDLVAADASPLRAAGYTWQFGIRTSPSAREFQEIDIMSNTSGSQTRIYGAQATDLDNDGFLDLATVNEVSSDIRVALSLADGTGLFDDFLPPTPIGVEASPNDAADFDRDGNTDICTAAAVSGSVWVLLGSGDGTFGSVQSISVGSEPHGVVALDVDGDGDSDIVNCNHGSDNLSLMLNDGNGTFGAPTFFNSGASGEYGLATADVDGDGIGDLVVAARDDELLVTLHGNGNGTFTPVLPGSPSGGATWVVALGDVDGDGILDATTANSFSFNGAVLIGNGDGTFGPPDTMPIGAHTVSTDLGDLDGDGDLDWVLASFGGGFWRIFENDGTGSFTFDQEITAPSNPSCAVLFDFDRDGDLDMALTDEIADVLVLMENQVDYATYCFGDGSGTACPCANGGAAGHGCENGTFAAGCLLVADGNASVSGDTLVLFSTQSTPSQPGLYFQGLNATNGGAGSPFGDGLRCAGGGVVRLQTRFADGTGAAHTTISIADKGGATPGDVLRYQFWYRDPTLSPCGNGFNLSNGVTIAWIP